MIQQIYIFTFTLTGIVCLLGVAGVRAYENPNLRRSLAGLLVCSGAWSLLTALQLAAATHFAELIHTAALVAGITTVFAWLSFASAYSGRQYHRQRSVQASAALIFLSIIAVKLTNPIHGLYFSTTIATEPFVHKTVSYHSPHWFVTGFSYTATAVGFLWLFESFDHNSRLTTDSDSRPRTLYVLVILTALPIIPYGLSSYSDLLVRINYEPLGVAVFTLGAAFYARTEFTQHSSPGESTLVDTLTDGGLVLDDADLVINTNERAVEMLGLSSIQRVPLATVDSDLASLDVGETKRVTYEHGGQRRVYEAKRSPAPDSLIASAVITLKDVTRAARLEQLMSLHREISEAVVNVTDPWEFIQQIPDRFATIDVYEFVWLYPTPDEYQQASSPSPGGFGHNSGPFPDDSTAVVGTVSGESNGYAQWAVSNAESTEPVLSAATAQQSHHAEITPTSGEWHSRLAQRGVTDSLAVPIQFSVQQPCVLGVYTTDEAGFDPAEKQLIENICRRVPEAIESIEAHQEALQYKEAITHAGTAVFITDIDGTIQYVNPAFEDLTGYAAAEAIDATPHILHSGEMEKTHYEKLWETILSGEVFQERIVNKTKSGDRYIAQQTISPVLDEDDEPVAFVAVQFEITDKLVREQRLSVLHRVLRHNLRTAVNVIDGHATLLEDRIDERLHRGKLPADVQDSIEQIRTHAEKLANQSDTAREIEQVLASDRTGRVSVPADDIVTTAREIAQSLGGDCTVTVDDDVSQWQVDAELNQVVEELVENALVHNQNDPAMVDVDVTMQRADTDLVITVEDDGPGMSEQELVFIEEGGEDPLRHGSGLDLWLVNWLTISLGGSITASTGDGGTTIRVTVPLRGQSGPDDSQRRSVVQK